MSETLTQPIIDSSLSTVSRIYCGMSKPNGGRVSTGELESFIRDTLAERFPDGYTVLNAMGGWRDMATGTTIEEPSAVFEVAHGRQDADRVLAVARAYKARFGQQSVMVASAPIETQFV